MPEDLRSTLQNLYPDRCLNGDGSDLQAGRVCTLITGMLDRLMAQVETGGLSEIQALATATDDADVVDRFCNGSDYVPPHSTLLKCGVDKRTFYTLSPEDEAHADSIDDK